jgi:hypothetical protein
MYYVIDDQMCVICYRIADMPRPRVPSERQRCRNCSEPIWVAKEWPAAPAKVCTHCMESDELARKKGSSRIGMTDAQAFIELGLA